MKILTMLHFTPHGALALDSYRVWLKLIFYSLSRMLTPVHIFLQATGGLFVVANLLFFFTGPLIVLNVFCIIELNF